jgi:peptidyl-prolyl cis-trans isomerase C
MSEQVRASHILVSTLEEANSLKEQLNNGVDFATLASLHSGCPSKQNGGDLGFFGRGMMVKPFEDAAFDTPVGQISEAVQTQFGYHLIKRSA